MLCGARVMRGDGAGRLRPLRPAAKTVLKSAVSGDDGFRVQRHTARATTPCNAGAAILAYTPRETAASRHLRHCRRSRCLSHVTARPLRAVCILCIIIYRARASVYGSDFVCTMYACVCVGVRVRTLAGLNS